MSHLRLYVDEDASQRAVIDALRELGNDVMTVADAKRVELSDRAQLEYAATHDRTMYTLNVADFARLHSAFLRESKEHAGIIVIPRQRYSIGEKIRRLTAFFESVSPNEMRDRFEFL